MATTPVKAPPSAAPKPQTRPKAKAAPAPATPAGMDTSTLFKLLFGPGGIPSSVNTTGNGIVGALGQHPTFPVDSPGYMLQMLFGQNAKASDYHNPNDVAYREGGIDAQAAQMREAELANQANGGYHETPQQYFMRMTKMAMGNGAAPVAPGAPVAPKVIKPVAPIKPVKPVAPVKPVTATAPVTAPANQGSLSGGFQTGEQFTAPPAPAPTPPPAVTPVQ